MATTLVVNLSWLQENILDGGSRLEIPAMNTIQMVFVTEGAAKKGLEQMQKDFEHLCISVNGTILKDTII